MAQPSVACYFATRKRSAVEETNIARAKKVLILDPSEESNGIKRGCDPNRNNNCDIIYAKKQDTCLNDKETSNAERNCNSEKEIKFPQRNRVVTKLSFDSVKISETSMTIKRTLTPKSKQKKISKETSKQPDIQSVILNMQKKKTDECDGSKLFVSKKNVQDINEKTPPVSPMKNAMDNISNNTELSLNEIKTKLTRSSRLADLKASIAKFNKSADKLKEVEKKISALNQTSPSLKTFKSIELEVQLSPTKVSTNNKSYLSPKKDVSPRKNLFGLLSPTKSSGTSVLSPTKVPAYQRFQVLASPEKPSLTLPYKYRCLAEMFRSIDTVCAMLFNRKETITFNKVKPAVQEMMRRNLYHQHFAQIKSLYPNAFNFNWEKMKQFASASRQEKYEFVITPVVNDVGEDLMNPTCLLNRKRILYNVLIEKVKDYHEEFLQSLDPPMNIPREKITRWHPEFDIEKIPDIAEADLPKQPEEEKITSGKEVLEKVRSLFNCNTRMERALEKLKQAQDNKVENKEVAVQTKVTSTLKGIPKALLEKVRAKQAAKALEAMTRSSSQDKEALMYSRLPEIARLMRNTYVAEKKGVLPLEEVIIKLNNSYRSYLSNSEIEQHLKLLCKSVPGWLVFHEIRGTLFVKLARDGDMSKVMNRLEELAKEKSSL